MATAPATRRSSCNTISGNISETGGSQSLTLSDAGTLILSGTNSYSGGTHVSEGTMYITSSSAIQDGSNLTVGAGGTFIFNPTMGGGVSPAGNSVRFLMEDTL